ncbi:flagellar protein FlgN [Mesobacillus harenae]|uniref:flagellar protein FlgN n=1 Tax=Mesobacillus harenae TaxID=2213203 RepID=UPI0015808995|nr:flagellar protein FlgN [Mesobacillus harenae]
MNLEAIVSTMTKLIKLHKSLFDLSVKKTDIIKKGDIESMNTLIKDEQTHIAAISKLEQERAIQASKLVPGINNPSIADLFEHLETPEKEKLSSLRDGLMDVVLKIQSQNQLNQQLLLQSIQFLNFSMSLVMPQAENYNYGPPQGKQGKVNSPAGMFNTKA